MIVLVDMDEVLADFTGGALAAHGLRWADILPGGRRPHALGTYDLATTLGVDTEEFWKPIDILGSHFWSTLRPLPWLSTLAQALVSIEWYIVSSPSLSPKQLASSHTGKLKWVRKHLPALERRCYINEHKHPFAHANTVLIDDRQSNVQAFVENGGHGITFPSYSNYLHNLREDPVPYVLDQLKELRCI